MPKYAPIQRLLHWLIALMALCVLAVGLIFMALGFDGVVKTFGQAGTDLLYKYHKTFGVIILAAMVLRLLARLVHGAPPYAAPLTPFEKAASFVVHRALYLCLFAMPVLGWLATGASGYPVEFFNWRLPPILPKSPPLGEALYTAHGAVGLLLLCLIALHFGAALRHGLIKRDGVVSRML